MHIAYALSRFATADKCRQRLVDHVWRWHGPTVPRRTARAGGCFLTLCILGGFAAGLAIGNPMKGVLAGTGIGAVLAVLLWLIDRRQAR
jgi:hypothetical protein